MASFLNVAHSRWGSHLSFLPRASARLTLQSTMKYHSDQALDLADNSYICIFSCYDNPINLRTLRIKNKLTVSPNLEMCINNIFFLNIFFLLSYFLGFALPLFFLYFRSMCEQKIR